MSNKPLVRPSHAPMPVRITDEPISGKIKNVVKNKYGFIESDDGQDIMFPGSACHDWEGEIPAVGTRVQCTVERSPSGKNPEAAHVWLERQSRYRRRQEDKFNSRHHLSKESSFKIESFCRLCICSWVPISMYYILSLFYSILFIRSRHMSALCGDQRHFQHEAFGLKYLETRDISKPPLPMFWAKFHITG